jgi:serine protease Do
MTRCSALRQALPLLVALLGLPPVPSAAQEQAVALNGRAGLDIVSPYLRQASAVVRITTTSNAPSSDFGPLLDPFSPAAQQFNPRRDPGEPSQRPDQERGLASGLIVSSNGEILTNAHAVCDADRAIVHLADGRQFNAKVLGLDKSSDVALIKIDAHGLPTAAIGHSEQVAAGEWVLAIGSPFGLDNSVTAGVVSAPHRFLPGNTVPLIQTDVAINPGSSGGPLLNLRGEVIGLNSMIFSHTGGYMGVSFSVPIDLAMRIADELRSSGRVSRGQLGAKIQELTPDLARSFGLPAPTGALVLRVQRASPAERSGLRSGDIVMGTGLIRNASYAQLQQEVAAARPGQRLALNVWRRGAVQRVDVTVGEAPPDLPARPAKEARRNDERLGLSLGEMPAARRDGLGLDSGLPVLESQGSALLGGVRRDDVIIAVGDRPVRSVAEFDVALAAVPAERPVALLVLRGRTFAYLAVDRGD